MYAPEKGFFIEKGRNKSILSTNEPILGLKFMIKTIIMKPYLVLNSVKAFASLVMMAGMLFPHPAIILAVDAKPVSEVFVLEKIEKLNKCPINKDLYGVKKTVKMWVTAYESKPEQTDDTPRISASGKEVFDGMVAMNGVPLGTKVRIPALFGNKELVVWDRMHSRKKGVIDVWMEDGAKEFGATLTLVEIREG